MPDDQELLREASLRLLERAKEAPLSEFAAAVDKATVALKYVEDQKHSNIAAEKLALELDKLRHEVKTAVQTDRSSRYKDYATLITPLVAIIGVVLTSVVQAMQTNIQIKAAHQQQDTAKKDVERREHDVRDAQWYAFASSLSRLTRRSPEVANIRKFTEQDEYRDRAQTLAAGILTDTKDMAIFEEVFKGAFTPVKSTNFPTVVRINQSLYAQARPLWTKSWDEKVQNNAYETKLTQDEQNTARYVDAVLPILSEAMGAYLKSRKIPDNIDLSNTTFSVADWSGVDFTGADLRYADFTRMDLKGAKLKGIRSFEGMSIFSTAWWQAQDIQPDLRAYLIRNYPCNSRQNYGPLATVHLSESQCSSLMEEQKRLLP